MSKSKAISKGVLGFFSIAVVVLVIGGAYVFYNLSGFVKPYIERTASQTLGVRVTLGGLDISLQDKSVRATNLKIGNPDGFKTSYAVLVPDINIVLDTVSQELVTFKDISVTGTEVNLEVTPNGTNLQAIRNQLNTAPQSPEEARNKEVAKVIINKLALSGAKINPSVTLIEGRNLEPVLVPPVYLNGIGRKENGVLAHEAMAQVFAAISRDLNQAAGNAGLLQGVSPDALKDMGATQVEQLKEKLKEDMGEIGGKLKGIFGD